MKYRSFRCTALFSLVRLVVCCGPSAHQFTASYTAHNTSPYTMNVGLTISADNDSGCDSDGSSKRTKIPPNSDAGDSVALNCKYAPFNSVRVAVQRTDINVPSVYIYSLGLEMASVNQLPNSVRVVGKDGVAKDVSVAAGQLFDLEHALPPNTSLAEAFVADFSTYKSLEARIGWMPDQKTLMVQVIDAKDDEIAEIGVPASEVSSNSVYTGQTSGDGYWYTSASLSTLGDHVNFSSNNTEAVIACDARGCQAN